MVLRADSEGTWCEGIRGRARCSNNGSGCGKWREKEKWRADMPRERSVRLEAVRNSKA